MATATVEQMAGWFARSLTFEDLTPRRDFEGVTGLFVIMHNTIVAIFDALTGLQKPEIIIVLVERLGDSNFLEYLSCLNGRQPEKTKNNVFWDYYFKLFYKMSFVLKANISKVGNQNVFQLQKQLKCAFQCSLATINILQQCDNFSEKNTVSLIMAQLHFLLSLECLRFPEECKEE